MCEIFIKCMFIFCREFFFCIKCLKDISNVVKCVLLVDFLLFYMIYLFFNIINDNKF